MARRKAFITVVGLAAALLCAGVAQAQLSEIETGGYMMEGPTSGQTNVALTSEGATPIASGAIDANWPIENLTDGIFLPTAGAAGGTWIMEGGDTEGFAGAAFASAVDLDRIAFANAFPLGDRVDAVYTFQTTTVANPDASTPDGDWTTQGAITVDNNVTNRHLVQFPTVSGATGFRIQISSLENEIALAEIEAYAALSGPAPEGFALIELDGAMSAGATAAQTNQALASEGATPFAQGQIDANWPVENLNDGNIEATSGAAGGTWIADVAASFAGVAFAAPIDLDRIAMDHAFGAGDRVDAVYEFQVTNVASPDAATPAQDWTTVGHYRVSNNETHRYLFSFPAVSGATGFRILMDATAMDAQIAFAEIEAYEALSGDFAPIVDFQADRTSGFAPLDVTFENLSGGAPTPTYAWEFGDGATSTETSPTHTYMTAGVYTVSLTATNSEGEVVETMTDYITVYPAAYLEEVGGSAGAGATAGLTNLAPGGTAFALDSLNDDWLPEKLNDQGTDANTTTWIAGSLNSFGGIALAEATDVDRVAIVSAFGNRSMGVYTVQVTRAASPDETTPDGEWETVLYYTVTDPAPTRRLLHFPIETGVTGVRVWQDEQEFDGLEPAIMELEIYAGEAGLIIGNYGSGANVPSGETLVLEAPFEAMGPFQWYRNGVALADDDRISGTDSAILFITELLVDDSDSYTVGYQDDEGADVESQPFVLNVIDAVTMPAAGLTGLAALAMALGLTGVTRRRK